MLKSLPMDLVLVVILVGAFKWLAEPSLGREGTFVAAAILAIGWVLFAKWRHRLWPNIAAALPRFLRQTDPG